MLSCIDSQEIRSNDIFQSTKFEVTVPANTRMIKAKLGALDGQSGLHHFLERISP